MRFLAMLFVLTLSTAASHAEGAPLQRGRYAGIDQSGRACEVFLVADFGSEQVRTFRLELASSSFYSYLNQKPSMPNSGVINGQENLMADGYISGRPYYRSFSGAPIFARVIETQYEMRYREGAPQSIVHRRRPFGSKGAFKEERCGSLRAATFTR